MTLAARCRAGLSWSARRLVTLANEDQTKDAAAVRTRRISNGDIEVQCYEAGRGAPPLLMLHGLTGHRDDFVQQLPELGRARRVLVPDLRGHGDAERVGNASAFGFDRLVADVLGILDGEGIEECHLLGHSFGGMVSLRFVLAHPERVRSLVLMSTSPFAPDHYDPEVLQKAAAIAQARGMAFLQELVEKAGRAEESPSPSELQTRKWGERYYEHQRKRYGAMEPLGYLELSRTMTGQESLVPRLGEVRCPTTVIVGEDDEGFLRGADAFEAGIPGVHRVTLEDAGHHPHVEAPDAWFAVLEAHFRRAG